MDKLQNSNGFEFFENVAQIIEHARKYVGRTADLTKCVTNFEVGRMIVEEEQGGRARAEYGAALIKKLSDYLNGRVGKGFSVSTLRNARQFYLVYNKPIHQAMLGEFGNNEAVKKHQALLGEFGIGPINKKSQAMISQLYPFTLSWSHYLILMRIKNDDERQFYEIEATNQNWSYRFMEEQFCKSLYERLALSRDKDAVMRLAKEGQTIEKPKDLLKNPLTLEFLGLADKAVYDENDLENAILSKLQDFLLELGKGFLFEARQKRFTFNEKHYKLDLVCYNRLLKCYVLIDLKTDTLEHKDLGQMLMYVHYFDRHVKTEDERPTVGIQLCKF